ncbi:MAG: hypothetical protein KKG59_05845 [Nanoarchaeota archaeon]|nr:hypothetical protein [Nanoarchaeota archaeon]
MVKITFLGTAGDAIVAGKQERASGGIILAGKDFQFHLDPGPGALVRAKEAGINLRENTALFVSNQSIIHNNDVNAVILAMTYDGMDKLGTLFIEQLASQNRNSNFKQLEKVISIKPNQKEYIKNSEIVSFKTTQGVGFKFFLDTLIGYAIGVEYSEQLVDKLKGCEMLILGCETPDVEANIVKVLKQIQPKTAIITSFGIKVLEKGPDLVAKDIQKKTRVKVIAADDGWAMDLQDKGQKHLDTFLKK